MTINGQTETIKTVFYADNPMAEGSDFEDTVLLALFNEVYTEFPAAPSFFVAIEISESLIGAKSIDLAQPLNQDQTPIPSLTMRAMASGIDTQIVYEKNAIDVDDSSSTTVESGSTMKVTRNGDSFTIDLTLNLSDGNQIHGSWSGKGTAFDPNNI